MPRSSTSSIAALRKISATWTDRYHSPGRAYMGMTRGLLITALFGIVLFVLIPVYVPRPRFIPGFAPPPDMWPQTVSIIGLLLGLLLLWLSFSKKTQAI